MKIFHLVSFVGTAKAGEFITTLDKYLPISSFVDVNEELSYEKVVYVIEPLSRDINIPIEK